MAIQKEIWSAYMVANLFKSNEFLRAALNADEFVLQGKVVHIPIVGSKPTVVKNRTEFPAEVSVRTDTDVTYSLDEYTGSPTRIPNADKYELSYDKMDSVIGEHVQTLAETVADDMLVKWAAAGLTIIRTSGEATLSHLADATGNRKRLLKEDLKAAQTAMNRANVPKANRYALIDSEMYAQLLDDADLKARDSAREVNLIDGAVMRLYGFDIFERSNVLSFNNVTPTPAVKALGAAGAATDNAAALCWQQNSVERAVGTTELFESLDDPEFYGDVYSSLMRAGGRRRRDAGVVAIVQDAAD